MPKAETSVKKSDKSTKPATKPSAKPTSTKMVKSTTKPVKSMKTTTTTQVKVVKTTTTTQVKISTKHVDPSKCKVLKKGTSVTNILGTTGCTSDIAGSWIQHWQKISGKPRPKYCSADECKGEVTEGGHVKIIPGAFLAAILPLEWYVIPVCKTHNMGLSCKTFHVKDGTIAVEASPDFLERVNSWSTGFKKFGLALKGEKR